MSHTTPVIANQQINLAFVIRLNWEQVSGEWHLLLKPTQGEEARLFCEVESIIARK